ncbi:ribosomal RNA small subunit methyltransferase C [Shewanella gelidii]|uniref:Ribosomal RNA small subunit methyltransferase C n=1 Tax=Shewanella gelidii TaxID=1642821 RepID=A0A917N981_9GAMM|nr:methyltransferase [Shewanella gelidii]GGI78300.1 ribosomal RNA small subunit methyltransferase C [Shewanella gelidii]
MSFYDLFSYNANQISIDKLTLVLSNPSQVLIRNSELFEHQRVLVLNYESDLLPLKLLENTTEVEALALDYHHHLTMVPHQSDRLHLHFGHSLPQSKIFDTVIVFFPKAKNLAPYLFALAASHLSESGQLLVVGENKGGIKSLAKNTHHCFSRFHKLDSARHCILFAAELVQSAPAIQLQDWSSSYQLETAAGTIEICNLVGVFSEKKIDAGTALMLENLPSLHGRTLDFGCGAGVIAAILLKQQPELEMECVDINAMALASCELTLQANDLKAKVYPSDGLKQTQGKFDAIISNPPFHDGLASTLSITTEFVAESRQRLNANGLWQIVANRHLPYSDAIAQHFDTVNCIAENNKYKIYQNRIK